MIKFYCLTDFLTLNPTFFVQRTFSRTISVQLRIQTILAINKWNFLLLTQFQLKNPLPPLGNVVVRLMLMSEFNIVLGGRGERGLSMKPHRTRNSIIFGQDCLVKVRSKDLEFFAALICFNFMHLVNIVYYQCVRCS